MLVTLKGIIANRWLGIWELFVNLSFCELVNLYQLVSNNSSIGYHHGRALTTTGLPNANFSATPPLD